MKESIVTLYKCDFCKKELKRKHAMINHELKCNNNPINNKACYGCKHLSNSEISVYFDYGYGDEGTEKKVNTFICTLLDKIMFPYSIEKKELHLKYDTYSEQDPMPKICESREEETDFNNYIF